MEDLLRFRYLSSISTKTLREDKVGIFSHLLGGESSKLAEIGKSVSASYIRKGVGEKHELRDVSGNFLFSGKAS
jgi:hypothetical protein